MYVLIEVYISGRPRPIAIKQPGPEFIKLEYSLKLKIKRSDWLLADTCPQTANHCAYFEFETVLKFYNLETSSLLLSEMIAKLELTLRTTLKTLKTEIKHKTPLQSKGCKSSFKSLRTRMEESELNTLDLWGQFKPQNRVTS